PLALLARRNHALGDLLDPVDIGDRRAPILLNDDRVLFSLECLHGDPLRYCMASIFTSDGSREPARAPQLVLASLSTARHQRDETVHQGRSAARDDTRPRRFEVKRRWWDR